MCSVTIGLLISPHINLSSLEEHMNQLSCIHLEKLIITETKDLTPDHLTPADPNFTSKIKCLPLEKIQPKYSDS